EVVSWTNEEGARFEPAMMCSGVVAGAFERDYVYGRTDPDGLRFEDGLRRIGYLGDERDRPATPFAYLELHVEQGPVLEDRGAPVGIVEGITCISWLEVRVSGQPSHAGPTPMRLRHDALVAAARMIDAVDRLVREQGEPAAGTVGRLALEPNIINVIPGSVTFSVDLRHPDAKTLERMAEALDEHCRAIAEASGVEVTIDRFWTSEPASFDSQVVAAVSGAVEQLGYPPERLWSGAGHDAKYVADFAPSGMIFVRSQGGLSHCPQEFSSPEDIEAGANVLLQTVLLLTDQ
ncbi:MAG TPA: M20 family metallo-hydrolase, partial [Thermomicrobiaceae bacterium]|nr:M20 family metallo-hydrolase [Thermomicrobiaceae bacterium]